MKHKIKYSFNIKNKKKNYHNIGDGGKFYNKTIYSDLYL